MTRVMSYAATALRAIASKLDGMGTVNNVHHHYDVYVYTMVDLSPAEIAAQIDHHMRLYQR